MTKHEIAVLACKILAIYIIAIALPHLGGIFYAYSAYGSTGPAGPVIGELVTFVLLLGLGVALWQNADRLAGSIIPPLADTSAPIPSAGGTDLLTIAFSILGLFVLTQAIPNIGNLLIGLLSQVIPGWQSLNEGSGFVFDAVTAVLRLALGLWLLVGSRNLAATISSRREPTGEGEKDDGPSG